VAETVEVGDRGSDGWLLDQLGRQLLAQGGQQDQVKALDAYFTGNPPLPGSAPKARDAYRLFQKVSRLNLAEAIVLSRTNRMLVTGFRTGADGDEAGDKAARDLWAASDLDVGAADVHQAMLAHGRAYVIVAPDDDAGGAPVATFEDARQVTTLNDPRRPDRVRAGLKVFRDEAEGLDFAYLYLPGRVLVASKQIPVAGADTALGGFRAADWTWEPDRFEKYGEGLGDVVGVVRFLNRAAMGEFEAHTDTLDRINTMILQRVVTAVMQAFRQRAIEGKLPEHDSRGNLIDYAEVFASGPDALWELGEGAKIWESAALDLTPMLSSVKDDIMQLAAATQTPMHMFTPDAAAGSAEGASLMREGVVATTKDRINRATSGWRRVMSLMFRMAGDEQRANLAELAPIWAPPEQWSMAERADASSKAKDVPWRSRMLHIWGFPSDLVDRMETERATDAFLEQALVAAASPPPSAASATTAPAAEPVGSGGGA